jgi:hypothetical protein
VRDALGPGGFVRVGANGAWDVDTAVARIPQLDCAAYRLPGRAVARVTRPGQVAAATKEVLVSRWLTSLGVRPGHRARGGKTNGNSPHEAGCRCRPETGRWGWL